MQNRTHEPTICCLQEAHFKYNNIGWIKVNAWKKFYHVSFIMNQRKAEEATFIPDKLYFRAKIITRNREGHYIMIKRSIHKEDIAILNMYLQQTTELQNM